MLTRENNERLCRVGPGTEMGTLMRRFWMPALLSTDLPTPDCDPRRVELLGDTFVAFRNTEGRVGMLGERCCHRGASLVLGRVEGCGIRCLYHGWKYAVDGTVLETPNVADPRFKIRVKAKAYPVREAGGIIWTYLGDPAQIPPFVNWPFLNLPESNRVGVHFVIDCNYLGVLEGTLDGSHLSTLHTTPLRGSAHSELSFAQKANHLQFDAAPRVEVEDTQFGFHYASLRKVTVDGKEQQRAMVTGFVPPFYMVNPMGDLLLFTVPMNDERTLFYHVFFDPDKKYGEEPLRSGQLRFIGADEETLVRFGMTLDTFESPTHARMENRYYQDRAAMRAGHYTGLHSFTQEDHAVVASAGKIRDRTEEHLCASDAAIARLHRLLLRELDALASGRPPTGLLVDLGQVRGNTGPVPSGMHWRTLVPTNVPGSQAQTGGSSG